MIVKVVRGHSGAELRVGEEYEVAVIIPVHAVVQDQRGSGSSTQNRYILRPHDGKAVYPYLWDADRFIVLSHTPLVAGGLCPCLECERSRAK